MCGDNATTDLPHDAAAQLPRPLWDMSTFSARFLSYWDIVNPSNLFYSHETISRAQQILQGKHYLSRSQASNDALRQEEQRKLRDALHVVDSAVHPETHEVLPVYFRRCFFTAFNTPLFFFISVTPQTMPWVVGWQAVNQAYNAFANYSYRSSDEVMGLSTLAKNFSLAISTATGTAVATRLLLNKFVGTTAASRGLLLSTAISFAPALTATLSASALNVMIVRRPEREDGVVVRMGPTGDHEALGKSKIAARDALIATMQSRFLLPVMSLFVPPVLSTWLARQPGKLSRPMYRMPIVMAAVFATQLVSLPLSLAPWPWFLESTVSQLEPEIQEAAAARGLSLDSPVYFNKGL